MISLAPCPCFSPPDLLVWPPVERTVHRCFHHLQQNQLSRRSTTRSGGPSLAPHRCPPTPSTAHCHVLYGCTARPAPPCLSRSCRFGTSRDTTSLFSLQLMRPLASVAATAFMVRMLRSMVRLILTLPSGEGTCHQLHQSAQPCCPRVSM